MLAVASLKRSLEFDPVEQGVKRKRAEMKLSPPSSPVSASASSTSTFASNANPSSPSKQQQQQTSIFTSSPSKSPSLVLKKPCSLTALAAASTTTATTDDVPMFNYTQTAQMCARLLREQDRSLREQYEELLSTKLAEQYDTFVRYTHDSVHKDRPKQAQPAQRLFHFGQQQEANNVSTAAFSYVS